MKEKIQQIIKELNKKEILPERAYRRNFALYPYISYINQSITCYISENHNGMALFLIRAYDEMNTVLKEGKVQLIHHDYVQLTMNYITMSAKYLTDHQLVEHTYKEKLLGIIHA